MATSYTYRHRLISILQNVDMKGIRWLAHRLPFWLIPAPGGPVTLIMEPTKAMSRARWNGSQLHARRALDGNAPSLLELRSDALPPPQPDRAPLPLAQRLPPHLLAPGKEFQSPSRRKSQGRIRMREGQCRERKGWRVCCQVEERGMEHGPRRRDLHGRMSRENGKRN